jgi:hypothetical protein
MSGTSGIKKDAAERYNTEVVRQVTAWSGTTTFEDGVNEAIAAAFEEITPTPGKTTRTVTVYDPKTGDPTETETVVPGFAIEPQTLRAARRVAASIVYANTEMPSEAQLRGGAVPRSEISATQARDLVRVITDTLAHGDMSQVPGLILESEDDTMMTFRYSAGGSSSTINIPKVILQNMVNLANDMRAKSNLPPIGEGKAPVPAPAPDTGAIPDAIPAPAAPVIPPDPALMEQSP